MAKANNVPLRFPRLNIQTEALLGKKNLKNHKRTHRALQMLAAAEKSGTSTTARISGLERLSRIS
jgi:hypothetical protein